METIFTCIAIDDEQPALKLMEGYITKTAGIKLEGAFKNPLKALDYLRTHPVDIIFTDISMPDLSGLNMIQLLDQKPLVVFTTAYSEFAVDAFEMDAVDYLKKPFSHERFLQAVNKAREYLRLREFNIVSLTAEQETKNYITIRADAKVIRIQLENILLVEALHEYVRIVTEKEKYLTFERLKNIEELLPKDKFIRIHRSYIVAIDKVSSLNGNLLQVAGQEVPVSRDMKDKVVKALFQ